jgi:hypothetical protein
MGEFGLAWVTNPAETRLKEPHACFILMIVREAQQYGYEEAICDTRWLSVSPLPVAIGTG